MEMFSEYVSIEYCECELHTEKHVARNSVDIDLTHPVLKIGFRELPHDYID